ncbi:MAG TPA: hypothetical protein VEL73_08305, partial [Mycobacteriales bacterium]|nr:hypothetical protein [Mycobacteriales bacterium]
DLADDHAASTEAVEAVEAVEPAAEIEVATQRAPGSSWVRALERVPAAGSEPTAEPVSVPERDGVPSTGSAPVAEQDAALPAGRDEGLHLGIPVPPLTVVIAPGLRRTDLAGQPSVGPPAANARQRTDGADGEVAGAGSRDAEALGGPGPDGQGPQGRQPGGPGTAGFADSGPGQPAGADSNGRAPRRGRRVARRPAGPPAHSTD